MFVSRQALTRHHLALWHVTVLPPAFSAIVQITPRVSVAVFEDTAVVAGHRLVVVVAGIHAVRFVLPRLYIGGVEVPGLAFVTGVGDCDGAGVDRTPGGENDPACCS